jgi:hypothetical protein
MYNVGSCVYYYDRVEILKNTMTEKTVTYASETSTLPKRGRRQLNNFGRKVYRRILAPVYENEKFMQL